MNLFSRLRIAMNSVVLKHLSFPKPFTLIGADSSLALCQHIADSGMERVMLITDKPLVDIGLVNPILTKLESLGVSVELFSEVQPDPGYDVVIRGVERLKQANSQAVLAVGGGSAMDCAKAIVHTHANNCHPEKLTGLWLYALPRKQGLPLYAIPTTAGTGSEVTIAAVLSDTVAQTKKPIIDPKITPKVVALDAKLTLGLPLSITASTGIDALTHAIEAYVSTMAFAETDEMALAASRLIFHYLPIVAEQGQDIDARQSMLLGSCLAGMAFTRAGVGYVHAFAHQLGGLYHVPHGLANAILLAPVLRLMLPNCQQRLANMAKHVGIGDNSMNDAQLADALIGRVETLCQSLAIPNKVEKLQASDYDRIIASAFAEAHGTYGVPRYLTKAQARQLLESVTA